MSSPPSNFRTGKASWPKLKAKGIHTEWHVFALFMELDKPQFVEKLSEASGVKTTQLTSFYTSCSTKFPKILPDWAAEQVAAAAGGQPTQQKLFEDLNILELHVWLEHSKYKKGGVPGVGEVGWENLKKQGVTSVFRLLAVACECASIEVFGAEMQKFGVRPQDSVKTWNAITSKITHPCMCSNVRQ